MGFGVQGILVGTMSSIDRLGLVNEDPAKTEAE